MAMPLTAQIIAKALGGRKAGGGWMARCPAHADREPSLSIRDADDGKVLVRCHAGCDQERVIATLRSRGLWMEKGPRRLTRPAPRAATTRQPDRDDAKRSAAALAIWQSAISADGSLVEAYLTSRGLHLPPPPTLRFHAALKHPAGGIWPAMVALVTNGADRTPVGVHRTFLACDGGGKAPVNPQKMMLGPCHGGAVQLGQGRDVLMVGEGIETCLAAMQASGRPAWAALSTSGLRALVLPREVRDVIVLADGDNPGEAAAQDCAWRWKREDRRVRIARPPQGMDFNDLLVGRTPRTHEAAR
jgi:putative DNA primase/helicase